MGRADYYKHGSWNGVCDSCGFKFKASELRRRWDGLWVDDRCWEPRQPQDFVRGKADKQTPPWTRPDPPPTFIGDLCTPLGTLSMSGEAVSGCWRAGRTPAFFGVSLAELIADLDPNG